MGILRTAFWLSAVVILLPAGNDNNPGGGKPGETAKVTADQVVVAAASTASDVSQFCARQPVVCNTSNAMLHLFEAKAKNSVRLIYNWAADTNLIGPANAAVATTDYDNLTTASADLDRLIGEVSGPKAKDRKTNGSQNTLRLDDVLPAWSVPKPKSDS